ncbi:MAG TPA: arsenate reductase ArsC [Methanomicrobia archaeon]|nr:arsenate reductase ArsC [Methanomicrobia archaeon]
MSQQTKKERVLFICTHNSARSQIAEGFLNALYGDRYEAYSAGTEPSNVHPYAVTVMAELGIDISKHQAKSVTEFIGTNFDYVVTICDAARETCPFFPGAKERIHQGFADPATFEGTDEERLRGFRRIRDEIKAWVEMRFRRRDNEE